MGDVPHRAIVSNIDRPRAMNTESKLSYNSLYSRLGNNNTSLALKKLDRLSLSNAPLELQVAE